MLTLGRPLFKRLMEAGFTVSVKSDYCTNFQISAYKRQEWQIALVLLSTMVGAINEDEDSSGDDLLLTGCLGKVYLMIVQYPGLMSTVAFPCMALDFSVPITVHYLRGAVGLQPLHYALLCRRYYAILCRRHTDCPCP